MIQKPCPVIFSKSRTGRRAYFLPVCDVPQKQVEELLPGVSLRTKKAGLPELSEPDVVRHYTHLSQLNYGVDSGFYPLGSCTMKYNPKINEDIARLPGLSAVHPLQPVQTVQGCLNIMYELEKALLDITGMAGITLQPAAGAHGELTGLMMIKAWHDSRGDTNRDQVIIPDSAHGTNPASAAVAGFKVVEVRSDKRGCVDIDALPEVLSERTAAIMLTNPNTLGLFEEDICRIAELVHASGGLLYYDGANANAILGIARPGDMGFDVVHLNLHKTFSTPHGGGGPGAGPVCVSKNLLPYLPTPVLIADGENFKFDYDRPLSIGRVKSNYGHFAVAVRALAYIMANGPQGLKDIARKAVLNANYLLNGLKDYYHIPFSRPCMHEFVMTGQKQKEETGISTLDIAKRLIDFGFHPPTIYFPMVVREAMMIEPTETENKETLDEFIAAMRQIAAECLEAPELIHNSPANTPVSRPDEVKAAKMPVIRWQKST